MNETLFYIFGIITALSFVGLVFYKIKSKSLKKDLDTALQTIISISKESKALVDYKKERESKRRRARYKTTGWHQSSESNNPNKHTWDVVFELKEAGQVSVDEKKSQFDVVDVFSENSSDGWDKSRYSDWFIGHTGGGWLDIDKKIKSGKFEWITTLSKSEIRDDKLDELGIK